VELRRALLLFAIVLGIAALVSAVSGPSERARNRTTAAEPPARPLTVPVPEAGPTPGPPPDATAGADGIKIDPKHKTARVAVGTAATLTVSVEEPGQVELDGLGLAATAEPSTPARFDLLVDSPGRYRVNFAPARGGEPRSIGTIDATARR
jgi:hypothetical protein